MFHSPNMTDVWPVKSQHQLKLFPLHTHNDFLVYSLILQTSEKNPHDTSKNEAQKPSKQFSF